MPTLVQPALPSGRLRDLTQPRLLVDELVLRPWEAADAPAVVRAYADPGIRRWHVRSMSNEEASAWIASWSRRWQEESGAGWAICQGDALLARVGLSTLNLEDGVGGVGYWVVPAARGRGVAPRALQAVSSWLFVHVGLHRLELAHSTLNASSCRVAAKAGYAEEGTARQQLLHEDGWHDMHLHARLRTDDPVSRSAGLCRSCGAPRARLHAALCQRFSTAPRPTPFLSVAERMFDAWQGRCWCSTTSRCSWSRRSGLTWRCWSSRGGRRHGGSLLMPS